MRDIYAHILHAVIVASAGVFIFLCILVPAYGQTMQSTNYRIQSDSINVGGGLGTSTNYRLESTAGEVATGDRSGSTYALRGGYQHMVSNYIAISASANVTMTPSIGGATGGTANGSTIVMVTTDSAAGYTLSIAAGQNPAMQSGANSIDNYAPGGTPSFDFTVGASDAFFGFSPSGEDITSRFLDNGASCGSGSTDSALACWDGITTSNAEIARATAANTPLGATTTVHFRVGVGASAAQAEGVYVATTTLTAVSL